MHTRALAHDPVKMLIAANVRMSIAICLGTRVEGALLDVERFSWKSVELFMIFLEEGKKPSVAFDLLVFLPSREF